MIGKVSRVTSNPFSVCPSSCGGSNNNTNNCDSIVTFNDDVNSCISEPGEHYIYESKQSKECETDYDMEREIMETKIEELTKQINRKRKKKK